MRFELKNIAKSLTREERKRYAKLSVEEQEAFLMERESKREKPREVDLENLYDFMKEFTENDKPLENDNPKMSEKKEEIEIVESVKAEEESFHAPPVFFDLTKDSGKREPERKKEVGYREEKENVRRMEHSHIYLETVLDTTFSFTEVFPAVYEALEACVLAIQKKKRDYPSIVVKYGLTVFHTDIMTVTYHGDAFTESEEEFLESLRELKFTGGSRYGTEPLLNAAIEAGIRSMECSSEKPENRGLLVVTDSMPDDDNYDFRNLSDCANRGLRFAAVYANSNSWIPDFRMVDGEGRNTLNVKNRTFVAELKRLFGVEGAEEVRRMVTEMMYQTSVHS